ncbi:MAG: hypothetical protein WC358_04690 [Ignavibacteria bacterium]|jgi:tetratricopeptide (TPR) repeat protein
MGPTKEELANYFKNNRKYFDELAHHYKQTDPEYYNKYIASFYRTPYISAGGKRTAKPVIAILAASLSVFIMGIVLFFMVNQKSLDEDINYDKEEIGNDIESDNINMLDTLSNLRELGDYEKGILYYELEEYGKAVKFFEKVPESSPLYKDARKKIVEMKKKSTDE